MEELLLRIKNMLKLTEEVGGEFSFGSLTLRPHALSAECGGKDLRLKPKEYSILDLLCRNEGRYVSAESILKNVWNNSDGSLQSVYTCLSGLREKLGETDVGIDFRRGDGYSVVINEK